MASNQMEVKILKLYQKNMKIKKKKALQKKKNS